MKPMKAGSARTALTENIGDLLIQYHSPDQIDPRAVKLVAAVLGGAVEAALEDMGHDKGLREIFWRYTNDNCWRMTRALRASGQLDKIK